QVDNPTIAEDSLFGAGASFVKAQQLDVSLKLLPLLHKQVEVDSVTLERPIVNLIKNQAGVWNFASVGHPSEAPAGAGSPSQAPTSAEPAKSEQFALGELKINDGQISVLDQQKGKTASVYDHIDVTLKDF